MGAFLFIDSIYHTRYARYMPYMTRWANRRDVLEQNRQKRDAQIAQNKVTHYFDKIYEKGCFGDNYSHNLLKQFRLSWHHEIVEGLLYHRDTITPSQAVELLGILRAREPIFEANLKTVKCFQGMNHAETVRYYRGKYARLQALLRQCIARKEKITVSL